MRDAHPAAVSARVASSHSRLPVAALSVRSRSRARRSAAVPVVVVDPGHDARANLTTEPIGPGSATRKIKDGGGTHGVVTGIREADLALDVSLRLRTLLRARVSGW